MHQQAHGGLPLPDPYLTTRACFALALGMALFDDWLFPAQQDRPSSERIVAELVEFQLHGVLHRSDPGS